MHRLLLVAAASLALAAPAAADAPVVCMTSVFNILCLPTPAPDARIVTDIGGADGYRNPDVTDADRAAWAQRCKPRQALVDYTSRWVYAERGCEVGVQPGEAGQ